MNKFRYPCFLLGSPRMARETRGAGVFFGPSPQVHVDTGEFLVVLGSYEPRFRLRCCKSEGGCWWSRSHWEQDHRDFLVWFLALIQGRTSEPGFLLHEWQTAWKRGCWFSTWSNFYIGGQRRNKRGLELIFHQLHSRAHQKKASAYWRRGRGGTAGWT